MRVEIKTDECGFFTVQILNFSLTTPKLPRGQIDIKKLG